MGVDSTLYLPAKVKLRDVTEVISILLGKQVKWVPLLENGQYGTAQDVCTDSGFVRLVEPVTNSTHENQPECVVINIPNLPTMFEQLWLFYSFESENNGMRFMSGRSRKDRIALHRRLADFFGGEVDYNDCDSVEVDYRRKSPSWLGKTDNKNFHAKEMAMWNLRPITQKEIDKCEKFASYKS